MTWEWRLAIQVELRSAQLHSRCDMMEEIRLPTDSGHLALRDERNWCRVYWVGSVEHFLGAEVISILKRKFLEMLRNRGNLKHSNKLGGIDVAWIASLCEIHTVIYASSDNEGLTLYFQSTDNAPVLLGQMTLTQLDCESWQSILSN